MDFVAQLGARLLLGALPSNLSSHFALPGFFPLVVLSLSFEAMLEFKKLSCMIFTGKRKGGHTNQAPVREIEVGVGNEKDHHGF